MRTAAGVAPVAAGATGAVLPIVPGRPRLAAGLARGDRNHHPSRALARR
jgi:hypothetical protein